MLSDRAIALAIAGLCILALAAGAASLGNPVEMGDDDRNERLWGTPDWADQERDVQETESNIIFAAGDEYTVCVDVLLERNVQLSFAIALLFGALVIWKLSNFIIMAAFLAGFGPAVMFGYLFFTLGCDFDEEETEDEPEEIESSLMDLFNGENASATVTTMTDAVTDPTLVLGAMIVIGLLAFAFVYLSEDDEEQIQEPDEAPGGDRVFDPSVIAKIAGEAADRIERDADTDSDLENEVYRAWKQMTDHLEVESPQTSTPGEFAEEAITIGLAEDDVMALTGLFEMVRYGAAGATPAQEREAVDILRRIEASYQQEDQ